MRIPRHVTIGGHPWPKWKDLGRQLWNKTDKDDVLGRAAELAYFVLFSAFPLLIVFTTILGMLAAGEDIRNSLLRYFSRIMPPSAYHLVVGALDDITTSAGGGTLSIGIVLTIFSASSGMTAVIEALNTAYEVREARPWWKRRLVAIALTLALAMFTIVALILVLYGSELGHAIATWGGFEPLFETVWGFLQWPVVVAFVLASFALVYRFAPNVKDQKWWWVLPGAVLGFLLWLGASFGLRLYLAYFNTYDKVYGSLGAVILLMLWFYLSGVAILVGGEANSVIENFAASAGDPEAKLPGEKAPGEPDPADEGAGRNQ